MDEGGLNTVFDMVRRGLWHLSYGTQVVRVTITRYAGMGRKGYGRTFPPLTPSLTHALPRSTSAFAHMKYQRREVQESLLSTTGTERREVR